MRLGAELMPLGSMMRISRWRGSCVVSVLLVLLCGELRTFPQRLTATNVPSFGGGNKQIGSTLRALKGGAHAEVY